MIVNLVTALPVEAGPLIERYELSRSEEANSIPVYENIEAGLRLAVSGIRVERAAQAVRSIAGHGQAWLNIGIAGHRSEAVGTCLLANRISDRVSGKSVYPHLGGFPTQLKTSHLVTVPEPELEYEEEAAFDMEAYGFFSAVLEYSVVELVAVLKIISDNPDHGTEKIGKTMVEDLVAAQLPLIGDCVARLQDLAGEYNRVYFTPTQFGQLQGRVHLTVTQRSQLLELCQRLLALGRGDELDALCTRSFSDGRALLTALKSLSLP